MTTLATLLVKVGVDAGGFHRGLDQVESRANKLGGVLDKAGKAMTVGLTAPIVGLGAGALKMSTDFNRAMANVGTLIPGNIQRINDLKAAVQGLAVDVGKDTDDLAQGVYEVISAFGDTAETVTILGINARAAAAGLSTTKEAIDLTSAVTLGYGDASAGAVQHAADLAFVATALGKTTFPELAASIGKVVPLAAALGVTQEELFAVMGTATGITGDTAEVATQLRSVLGEMMAPSKAMSDLLAKLGFASGEAMLKQLGLQGSIRAIVGAATAAGVPLQQFLGRVEGQTLALALAGPLADRFSATLAAMGSAAGATDVAFAAQTTGVNAAGFAWQQMQARLQVVLQQLGDQLAPSLLVVAQNAQPLLGAVAGLVGWFASLPGPVQTAGLGLLAVLAAVGPLLIVLGALASGISVLLPLLPLFGAALTLATGPIGIIVVAIGLLVAGIVLLVANWEWVTERVPILGVAFEAVRSVIMAVVTWLMGVPGQVAAIWQQIEQTTTGAWTAITGAVMGGLAAVQGGLEGAGQAAQATVAGTHQGIQQTIQGVWDQIPEDIRADLILIGSTLVQRGAEQVMSWTKTGTDLLTQTQGAWGSITTTVGTKAGEIVTQVSTTGGEIARSVESAWTTASGHTSRLWGDISGTVSAKADEAAGHVTRFAGDVLTIIQNLATDIWSAATEVGDAIGRGIGHGLDKLKGWLKQKAREIAQAALDAAKKALGIGSPSLVFAEQVGQPMAAGLIAGLAGMEARVRAAVASLVLPSPELAAAAVAAPLPALATRGERTVNLTIELDGRVIAQAIGQPLVEEIRLRQGVRW